MSAPKPSLLEVTKDLVEALSALMHLLSSKPEPLFGEGESGQFATDCTISWCLETLDEARAAVVDAESEDTTGICPTCGQLTISSILADLLKKANGTPPTAPAAPLPPFTTPYPPGAYPLPGVYPLPNGINTVPFTYCRTVLSDSANGVSSL